MESVSFSNDRFVWRHYEQATIVSRPLLAAFKHAARERFNKEGRKKGLRLPAIIYWARIFLPPHQLAPYVEMTACAYPMPVDSSRPAPSGCSAQEQP